MPAMLKLVRPPKEFRPRVVVDDILTLRNLVADGVGVGLLPRFVTEPHVAEGRLQAIMPSHTLGSTHLSLVYPSSGQVPRKVTAFRDFLVERLKARPLVAGERHPRYLSTPVTCLHTGTQPFAVLSVQKTVCPPGEFAALPIIANRC
jgi:hypothetical protein